MKFENVYQITQWGGGKGAGKVPLWICCIPSELLAEKAVIYRRTPERRDGYQRELSANRLGKGKLGVTGYLLNQMGIFPTSVLVNIRKEEGKVKFERKYAVDENVQVGDLSIPDDVNWYVMDGQHRIEGLKAAMREKNEFAKYPVIVTFTNEDIYYEMLIFYMVNARQKSVPTGLAYRILQSTVYDLKAPEWAKSIMGTGADRRKAIAATIVDHLNTKENSPFKGKICEEGEVWESYHLVQDATLIRYISIILRERIFSDMYDEDVADLLASYWTAIKNIYPECFENHSDYLLLGTIGLSTLTRLFPVIYGYCVADRDISRKNMEKYLRYLLEETKEHSDPDFRRPIDCKWWHKVDGPGVVHGTGEGHYQQVAQKFAEKISIVVKRERSKR